MRIEITDFNDDNKHIDVDFEVGPVLVNLKFSKRDLLALSAIVDEGLVFISEKKILATKIGGEAGNQ